jgi:hypothetical protein
MRKHILSICILALLMGVPLSALAQHDHTAPPDAGQTLRETNAQRIVRAASDKMEKPAPTAPDAPYRVVDGGVALPADLCRNNRAACAQEKEPKP